MSSDSNNHTDSYSINKETKQGTDLLFERLYNFKANAPETEEQFYRQSFDIFSKLISNVKTRHSKTLNNDFDIVDLVYEYYDLSSGYEKTKDVAKVWALVIKLFSQPKDYTFELIEWLNEFDNLPSYKDQWETVQHNLVRGQFHDVISSLEDCLQNIPTEDYAGINSVIGLVEQFQEIRDHVEEEAAYKEKWIDWNESCRLNKENYHGEKQYILDLFSVLTGQPLDDSFSFFEKVIGSTLYSRPLVGLTGLNSLAQDIDSEKVDHPIDMICAYLIQGRYDDALDYDNEWLQAHLGHALIALGVYDSDEESLTILSNGERILNAVYGSIQQYAWMIAHEFDMWNEAIGYLSVCQENREVWVIDLVGKPALPSKDIQGLETVLRTADNYDMPNVKKHIHMSIGHRYEHQTLIREATVEYGKAHDLASLDRLAHREFSDYLKNGTLNNVVIDMEELKDSPHYAVLIEYRLFKQNLEEKRWKEASKGLLLLLKNKRLPNRFQIVLLIDNLLILQESEHYYLSNQILELLTTFKAVEKDEFISRYYNFIHTVELTTPVVISKLRESLAYKAATAPAVY